MQQSDELVVLQYRDLLSSDPAMKAFLLSAVAQAYGPNGLGILTVAGVPTLLDLRQQLLPLSSQFVRLPEPVLARYEDPPSSYSFGWSHGREAMEDGRVDTLKGSYYANPLVDNENLPQDLQDQYPSYCRPNIWPDRDLPHLRPAFQALGRLMVEVGRLVLDLCDEYVQSQGSLLPPGKLLKIVEKGTACCKARLLHYFPSPGNDCNSNGGFANWCGWHNDHGSLTGLVSAMYMREGTPVENPDPDSGLYIRDKHGRTVRARIPADHIAYQMGEAMQVHSGGLLRATMHCVRGAAGAAAARVTRHSFAVFMQPSCCQES
ncbi:Clavaminate synthase-like protein [Coccomyxa subellipsoidea C-169]|uniref:Clavaminate synthase-like protein n=1 Tax=Coccomyxa subellipsoidea (strain C-169) TaxID=574566 RepID=I0YNU4_COCSC|nr:Clavaminate synthase-like protein [Coccomyxa subellipsoidea C-169]EIE20063.1 Clavaminate synthase-like protein [Coccomyxa subellipsoidea C-169]|eukprot:XP_005644607.1 Clavaminate synthase-like protein [Coccomyxa subellipsoidea C-169]